MDNLPPHDIDISYCFHCGLEVPDGFSISVDVAGHSRPMCCYGCEAVARTIVETGNEEYYRHRTRSATTAGDIVPEFLEQISLYDNERLQKEFVSVSDDNLVQVDLILEGINCAACLWLNQKHLHALPGVKQATINYSTHRAHVSWDPLQLKLSEIIEAVARIGYRAHPYDARRYQAVFKKQKNALLKRMGLAYVLGMQLMIIAVALYSGHWSGMAQDHHEMFRWLSFLLALPILIYSGKPFYQSAWKDIRHRHAGVDVPVSIGLSIAMLASAIATISGQGEVYFDSVAMFIALLLTARYLELTTRYKAAQASQQFTQSMPLKAHRIKDDSEELVTAADLDIGDRVRVRPGETIPSDGIVVEGNSYANESLVSGESKPVSKQRNSRVIGGTVNIEGILIIKVDRTFDNSVFSSITSMIERAHFDKPAWTATVDKLAPWFVLFVLSAALLVAAWWGYYYKDQWVWVTVSVLIVSCPCALSLATPLAISAATKGLMGRGILVASPQLFEVLPTASCFVFDKTGTLTTACFKIDTIDLFSEMSETDLLQIAASIEQYSGHPLAQVLLDENTQSLLKVSNHNIFPGSGLSGQIDGITYYMGTKEYVLQASECQDEEFQSSLHSQTEVWIAKKRRVLACVAMSDSLRPDARQLIKFIQSQGKRVILLSGDNRKTVSHIASLLKVKESLADMSPQDKLEYIHALQQQGQKVVMVGDGVNDAPVLKQADVSLTLQSSTDLAIVNSDCTILSNNLSRIIDLYHYSRKTRSVIRQNIYWAIAYNVTALPLAASGLVYPWLAASGMAISSFVVTINSMRLMRTGKLI